MGQRLSLKERKHSSFLETSQIPPHLWIIILNKTNVGSFPKLYRTCRDVKQLIDRGQSSIRIRTSCVLDISTKKQKNEAVVAYTIRPSWFGDGITCVLNVGDRIDHHFLLISCFRLAKLSFISLEENSTETKNWIMRQLKENRVQAEKISFGQYGYSSDVLRQLKANAVEVTDSFLNIDDQTVPKDTDGMKGMALRLEQLSSRNMTKAFQEFLPKYRHVDILGKKQSDERLFTEIFILLQKIASDKCDTESIKLIVFHHNFSSVQWFLQQLCLKAKLIHCDDNNYLFSMSRKSLVENVLVYLYCEKEVKIRMKVCKTKRNDEVINFLRTAIPIDQSNARFLADVSKNIIGNM